MKSKVNLKPCPFCGGQVHLSAAPLTGSAHIICKGCGLDAYFYGNEFNISGMKAAWERRINNDDKGLCSGTE